VAGEGVGGSEGRPIAQGAYVRVRGHFALAGVITWLHFATHLTFGLALTALLGALLGSLPFLRFIFKERGAQNELL